MLTYKANSRYQPNLNSVKSVLTNNFDSEMSGHHQQPDPYSTFEKLGQDVLHKIISDCGEKLDFLLDDIAKQMINDEFVGCGSTGSFGSILEESLMMGNSSMNNQGLETSTSSSTQLDSTQVSQNFIEQPPALNSTKINESVSESTQNSVHFVPLEPEISVDDISQVSSLSQLPQKRQNQTEPNVIYSHDFATVTETAGVTTEQRDQNGGLSLSHSHNDLDDLDNSIKSLTLLQVEDEHDQEQSTSTITKKSNTTTDLVSSVDEIMREETEMIDSESVSIKMENNVQPKEQTIPQQTDSIKKDLDEHNSMSTIESDNSLLSESSSEIADGNIEKAISPIVADAKSKRSVDNDDVRIQSRTHQISDSISSTQKLSTSETSSLGPGREMTLDKFEVESYGDDFLE